MSTAARREGAAPDLLLVFAKAPRPGRVKTRIAARVGAAAAARLYRALGRRVVDQVRGGRYGIEVHYDPPDALEEMRAWLGDDLPYRPQAAGDLGGRMAAALDGALARAPRAAVVGTDVPGLHRARVAEAFRALDGADAVLGPTLDGGYYLVGLRAPAPGLFEGVPWSTPRVLNETLARARREGRTVALLPALADVDHLEDVPTDLLPHLLDEPPPGGLPDGR